MDSRTLRALPVLFAVGGVWGGSFLFIKVIVEDTGPMELVLGRLAFGLLAIGGYMLFTRRVPHASPKVLAQVSVMALLSNILPFGLIAWGEEHIPSGTASVLNATVPIFTAVVAAAVLDEEHFTSARLTGLLLGLLGVAVLTGDDVLHITDSNVLGQLAVVGAAVCYGCGAVVARNLLRTQDPVNLSLLQVGLGVVYSVPLVFIISGGVPDYSLHWDAWASLIALGTLGTGFAYIGWLWLIEQVGSVRGSLVTYIVPVIAVFLGWIVLDEGIGLNTIAGGTLIIAGVASVLRGQTPARRAGEPVEAVPAAVGE